MADKIIQSETLQNIADAIRAKDGTSADIQVSNFATRIENIPSGSDGINYVEFEDDEILPSQVFQGRAIKKFYGYNITSVANGNMYFYTSQVQEVFMPNITSTNNGNYVLVNCHKLERASMPKLATYQTGNFCNGCENLRILDVCFTQFTANRVINDCTSLNKIVLRTQNLSPLSDTTGFANTPFGLSGGVVYVPSNLITDYEVATNWSSILANFISIENSRFANENWIENLDGEVTLDGTKIDILKNETIAMFKHTEGVSHIYEDGVELTDDTELVKDHPTLTTTI